jgi:hypothetical protein
VIRSNVASSVAAWNGAVTATPARRRSRRETFGLRPSPARTAHPGERRPAGNVSQQGSASTGPETRREAVATAARLSDPVHGHRPRLLPSPLPPLRRSRASRDRHRPGGGAWLIPMACTRVAHRPVLDSTAPPAGPPSRTPPDLHDGERNGRQHRPAAVHTIAQPTIEARHRDRPHHRPPEHDLVHASTPPCRPAARSAHRQESPRQCSVGDVGRIVRNCCEAGVVAVQRVLQRRWSRWGRGRSSPSLPKQIVPAERLTPGPGPVTPPVV